LVGDYSTFLFFGGRRIGYFSLSGEGKGKGTSLTINKVEYLRGGIFGAKNFQEFFGYWGFSGN